MSAHVRSIFRPRDLHHEFVRVMTHATVEKRTLDYDEALGLYLARGASRFEAETKAARAIRPYEVLVGDQNAMVDKGIDPALLLLVGGGGTAFNNANARLGVGDSATRHGKGRCWPQVAGIAVDDVTISAVVAALGSNRQPIAIDRGRIDRQIRELALEHAEGLLGDEAYLTRLKALREQRDAITERTAPGLPGQRAVEWLRALGESVLFADVPAEKADLLHAIYERIMVPGPEIVGVRLTPAAYAHGLALALPEKVVMARPTGVGRATATYSLPIEGRDEWLAAARRLA